MTHPGILFALTLLSSPSLRAQSLSADEARERILSSGSPILTTLTTHIHPRSSAKQSISLPLCYSTSNLYAFARPDGGFILASSSPLLPPVMGYSDAAQSFDSAICSASFNAWIQAAETYIRQMNLGEDTKTQQSSKINTPGPIIRPCGTKQKVEPLMHDTWHQYKPYNLLCPTDQHGDTCVTGCVATAMAQVMNYWKHPTTGQGIHSYTDTEGCGKTLSVDFSSHTYSWTDILNNYDSAYNDYQAQAVATLLRDCGVAVDMKYGAGSSGAKSIKQCQALVRHFDYDDGIQMYYRSFFSQQEWDSLMFTELSLGRPIIVSAYSPTLAHSLTCDGYDEQGLFHLNFGNPDGDANGYYYFTWLTPQQPTWYDINSPEKGMNLLQSITVGVQPNQHTSHQRHFFGFSHLSSPDSNHIIVHNLGNLGWNEQNDIVGIALKSSDAPAETSLQDTPLLYTYSRHFLLEEIDDTCYTDTLTLSWPKNLPDGSYRICPVFEEQGLLIEARTQQGTPNFLYATLQNGSYRISEPTIHKAELSISNIHFPDSIEQRSYPEFSFTIHNNGKEYNGRIYIALSNAHTTWGENVFAQEGLSISAADSYERYFHQQRIPAYHPGVYELRFYADADVFTDSLQLIPCDSTHTIELLPTGYFTNIPNVPYETLPSKNQNSSIIYNLNGQRLNGLFDTLPPGIYLKNRQKVIKRE